MSASSPSSSVSNRPRLGFFEDLCSYPVVAGLGSVVRSAVPKPIGDVEVRGAMRENILDVGLVPVWDAMVNPNLNVLGASVISVTGPSGMFMVVSKVLPGEINHVLVDRNDYGVAELAGLMLYNSVRTRPEFHPSEVPLDPFRFNFREDPHDAYLVTGRNSLFMRKDAFAWTMDITQAWHDWTKLPFVALCWAAKKGAPLGTLEKELIEVAKRSIGEMDSVARRVAEPLGIPHMGIQAFLTRVLKTDMTPNELTSMRRFQKELVSGGYAPQTAAITLAAAGTQSKPR